ncbi:MAG: hypothetical protein K2X48_06920 [Chitinophagaceae bacterium]|nr:hypothetical protein [Chitinophagaceae bacterium]
MFSKLWENTPKADKATLFFIPFFSILVLLCRFFLQGASYFNSFTFKKIGVSKNILNKAHLIILQINLFNIYFLFIGILILWGWGLSFTLTSILSVILSVLCTCLLNNIIKQLSVLYSFVNYLYGVMLFCSIVFFFEFSSTVIQISLGYVFIALLVGFILLMICEIKILSLTLSYEYLKFSNIKITWLKANRNLMFAWINIDFALLLRVKRMRNIWLGYFFILVMYVVSLLGKGVHDDFFIFSLTFFSLFFLCAYYGQNFISWDSSYISFILINTGVENISSYVKARFYTLCFLISISFFCMLSINVIFFPSLKNFLDVTLLYIYCLSTLPLLFITTGLNNRRKISLKEKSIFSHWSDGSSIPGIPFLLFFTFTLAIFIFFDSIGKKQQFFYILSIVSFSLFLFHPYFLSKVTKKIQKNKHDIYNRFNY